VAAGSGVGLEVVGVGLSLGAVAVGCGVAVGSSSPGDTRAQAVRNAASNGNAARRGACFRRIMQLF
jgi:hypothetical protein